MAIVFADKVKVRSHSSGTTEFILETVVPGFQSFAAIGAGNECYYGIEDGAGNWEVGRGTYDTDSSQEILTRDSVISSSNSNNLVNFPRGGKTVFVTIPSSVAASIVASSASDSFKTIAVSGQSNVVADSATDTLTLISGDGIDITTNATNDSITIATDLSAVSQNIIPSVDSDGTTGYTLGNASFKWKELFVSNGSIYIGDIKLSNVGGKLAAVKVINPGEENEVEDPEDSDATSEIVAGVGVVEGSIYKINIAGDDSTLLVDSDNGKIVGYVENDRFTVDGNDYQVRIGVGAGATTQGTDAIAIGEGAGNYQQGTRSVAIGRGSGNADQGISAVGIGFCAGGAEQGDYAVAIGFKAGRGPMAGDPDPAQPNNSIIINASGDKLNGTNSGLYVDPVREDTGNTAKAIYYNTTTKELTYANPTGGGDAANLVSNDDINITINNDDSSSYTWNFGQTGNLTFPDGSVQTTAYTAVINVSKFVLVNVDGGVFGSDDGENWSSPFDTGLSGIRRVAVGPSRVVYIGSTEPDPEYNNLYQTTAWNVTPTLVTDEGPANWQQVRYFSSIERFVAVGSIDGVAAYKHSSDGITWVTVYIDTEWAATLNEGGGPGTSGFTDVATNGTGFLLTTDNTILGSFYTTTLTSNSSIGESAWLNDGMDFQEVVYAAQGAFTGWFAFGNGNTAAGDGWWYNSGFNPSNDSFVTNWGISDISEAFASTVGYEPNWSELVIGRYDEIDTIVIATNDGQILYWPAVPEGPFVSIPKPYTSTITNISSNTVASISFTGASEASPVEKIVITGVTPSDFNGTYYYNVSNTGLYTDSALTSPFDTSLLTYVSGGTITWSHGMYIDALNYANGNFYVANDSEEVFVSTDGGATWTEVASLNPEGSPGEGGDGAGTGTDYMNDIDGFVGTTGGVSTDTGDITFEGVKIIGQAASERYGLINLVPALSANDGFQNINFLDSGQFISIYPTMAFDAPHIHIAAGLGLEDAEGDLFLGDDNKYVEINHFGNVRIQSFDNNTNTAYRWEFDNGGDLTIPGNIRSESNINIDINLTDSTLRRWQFGEDGDLTVPNNIVFRNGGYIEDSEGFFVATDGGFVIQTNKTAGQLDFSFGADGTLTLPGAVVSATDSPVQGTFSVGAATAITVTNSPNANWLVGSGVSANGISFNIAVDGSGNATVSSISDGGTGHFVGETFGPLPGTTFGGATPADDMYFEVTAVDPTLPAALDLAKQTQILTAAAGTGVYSLANGSEGQIMYFVPAGGVTSDVYIQIANARIMGEGPTDVTDYSWTPFTGELLAPTTIAMAIFADGAWCLRGGATD